MASYATKFGTLHMERSEKEDAVHIGFDGALGSGFFSVPAGKGELLRAAGLFGALMALHGAGKRSRAHHRARRKERQRERGAFRSRGGFGGGRRHR